MLKSSWLNFLFLVSTPRNHFLLSLLQLFHLLLVNRVELILKFIDHLSVFSRLFHSDLGNLKFSYSFDFALYFLSHSFIAFSFVLQHSLLKCLEWHESFLLNFLFESKIDFLQSLVHRKRFWTFIGLTGLGDKIRSYHLSMSNWRNNRWEQALMSSTFMSTDF